MLFELPKLKYELDALAPYISKETLEFHYGKHHQAYVNNLNNLIPGTKFEGMSLEEIILSSEGGIFNNAAQIWNHTFFWNSLSPKGGGVPRGEIGSKIEKTYGSFEKFKEEFNKQSLANFGSGWTWLVKDNKNEISILNTSNADLPLRYQKVPLLVVDVWEHAYYIDYRNNRGNFLNAFWNLVDWDFVSSNFEK